MIQGFSSGFLNRKLMYNLDLPSFQRDFASLKTLDHGTGPAITFTRASGGTYFDADGVLQTAANDVPRFDHDPATGASRGLLIEEARTNLLTHSAEIDDANWVKTNTAVTANAETAPDGTVAADKLTSNNASGGYIVSRTGNVTTGTTYAGTVFLKAGEVTNAFVGFSGSGFTAAFAAVDLATGAVSPSALAGLTSASATNVGNGWWRVTVIDDAASTNNGALTVYLASDDVWANRTDAISSGNGLYIWGAQLEEGAFPTSYIPTTTAAATRSADSAVVTPISSFYNQSEGTLFAECRQVVDSASQDQIAFVDDNTLGNRIGYICTTANKRVEGRVVAAFVQQDAFASASNTTLGAPIIKVGLAYKVNDMAFATGFSSTVQTDSSATIPSSLTHLRLGENASGGRSAIHIRKIAYYPRRLSDTLLEQLTT